jgi:tetratricopeptide (TPR) repeat protein
MSAHPATAGLVGLIAAGLLAAAGCGDAEHPGLGLPPPESSSEAQPGDIGSTNKPRGTLSPVAAPRPGGAELAPASSAPEFAEEAYKRWAVLIATGLNDEARALCTTWLEHAEPGYRVEAHKCLANVEMAAGRLAAAATLTPGATQLQPRIEPSAVEKALSHYDAAIAISPLEPQAHMGRIDVLILSGRYRDANLALDETLTAFDSRRELEHWFKLLGRFQALGKHQEGLAYLEVIEQHHPMDHIVISNLGAYYAMNGRHDQALEYAKQAVILSPDDPINRWNLARLYDRAGQLELANRAYIEALALFQDEDPQAKCDYAEFLSERVGDTRRACEFARERCSDHYDAHCGESG